MGIFDLKDPAARARGKAFQQRFPEPEGMKNIMGSMIVSMIEWRLATHGSKSPISHQEFIDEQIDKAIRPSPVPTTTDIDVQAQQRTEGVRRKLRSRKGRRGTILTGDGLGVGDTKKKSLLGG